MRKTLAIFEKEFKSFFFSPMAYIVIGFFTILAVSSSICIYKFH